MTVVTLHIEGMSCGHCLNSVRTALSGLAGVTIRSVTMGRAEVEVAAGGPTPDAIAGVVSDEGYMTTPTVDGR
jgi:copper chaperone